MLTWLFRAGQEEEESRWGDMYPNQAMHPRNLPQRENCGWVELGRERWRGSHSGVGASNGGTEAAGGVKVGAREGWVELPIAREEEEAIEGAGGGIHRVSYAGQVK